MHVSAGIIAAGAVVLVIWIAVAGSWCRSARRSWREAAAWAEFSRVYRDLDRELDGFWGQR